MQQRLRLVEIDNRDFEGVVRSYTGPRTLFYVDPPYLGVEDYYKHADGTFTIDDHRRLAHLLNEIEGSVVLSYYEHPLLDEWYPAPKWRRLTWKTRKHSQRTRETHDEATELLLCNYPAASASLWDDREEEPA
jgi:DNA adenine methylase